MDDISISTFIVILILLILSAFFSASETAFSSVNMIRLHTMADDGNKKARLTIKVADQFDKLIATILIGNNLVNIAISSLFTVVAGHYFGSYAVAAATGITTLLVLTFGEIIPKSLAKIHAEQLATAFAPILNVLMTILTPISWLFLQLTRLLKKHDIDEEGKDKTPSITEQELLYMLDTIEEEGVLEESEKELVQSALEFNDTMVEDVLTPRVNVFALDADSNTAEALDEIMDEGFSRIPIFNETIDHIIGIVQTRDILQHAVKHEDINLRAIATEPLYIHRTMKIARLLTEFQHNKIHIAVVMDDYGGTLGIVTMEDVLEELVGEIYDERDEIVTEFTETEKNTYEICGDIDVDDFFDQIDYHPSFISEDDYDTMNGWALSMMDHIPKVGESFEAGLMSVTILEMDEQKITKMRIVLHEEKKDDSEEDS